MTKGVKIKGKIRVFVILLIVLGALLLLGNIPIYFLDIKAGIAVSVFVLVYFAVFLCLWLYLTRHTDGMKWIFSMDQFCKWCGCSLPTGRKAKQELLNPELGYLVPVKGKKNDYDFYEYPEQLKQLMKDDYKKHNLQ